MEDKILLSNIENKIEHTRRYEVISHTNFLDPYQAALTKGLLKGVHHCFYGGYADCERTMLFLLPEYMNEPVFDEHIRIVEILCPHAQGLGHRDYLGSVLGLGIRRDKIGDILVHEKGCDLIVMADIAEYIAQNLDKVARAAAICETKPLNQLRLPNLKEQISRVIVSSLRLDCVISGVFQLSRNEASACIRSKKVFVNWQIVEEISKQLKEGDTISLRKKGRFVLQAVTGNTKKGRLVLEVRRNE